MNNEFALKELTDVTLKATYPIEVEGRMFEEGEVIARFEKIQIANFREVTSRAKATGGKHNPALVTWDDTKEITLNFTQGIFSKKQLALLTNSKLVVTKPSEKISISGHYSGESDRAGQIQLEKNLTKVFVYSADSYEKITPVSVDYEKGIVVIDQVFYNVEIDYEYLYDNGATVLCIGQRLFKGFLRLEGKSRVKDDITGKTRTAILRIPRLRLVSDLSMRLGREASPMLANFSAVGYPSRENGEMEVMEMLFLNDDIDAEM